MYPYSIWFYFHRNGLLTEHNLVEVNGQNVVGLKVSSREDYFGSTGFQKLLYSLYVFIQSQLSFLNLNDV